MPKLDRLARSVPGARAIADHLLQRGVRLPLGLSIHGSPDPMDRMLFDVLAIFAEFEADLIRMHARKGMAIARAKGAPEGQATQALRAPVREVVRMHATGDHSISDLAEVFSVSRPTIYRTLRRQSFA